MTKEELTILEASVLNGTYMKMFDWTKSHERKVKKEHKELMELWHRAFAEVGDYSTPPWNCRPCYTQTLAKLKRHKTVQAHA